MKPFRLQDLPTVLAALATLAFLATNSAHAFTIDTQSGTNPDGSAKFADPDEEIENFTSGKGALSRGNGFFNFDLKPFSDSNRRAPLFTPDYPAYRTTPDR